MARIVAVDYDGGKALFHVKQLAVVVDTNKLDVERVSGKKSALTAAAWMKCAPDLAHPKVWDELADAAVTTLEVQQKEAATAERKFRIPQDVKNEVQKALDWTTGFDRGHSAIGSTFAEQLLNDTYLPQSRVERIHRYFQRRPQAITENSGWRDGEPGFPTDDRIRYGLWGGDAARDWTSKIMEKHAVTAAAPAPSADSASGDGAVDPEIMGDEHVDPEVDGNAPHQFVPDPDIPGACLICGRPADDPIHVVPDEEDMLPTDTEDPTEGDGEDVIMFSFDDPYDYFGKGFDPDSTRVNDLYRRDQESGAWEQYNGGDWSEMDDPEPTAVIIMLDPDSVQVLADWLRSLLGQPGEDDELQTGFELSSINPTEAALFAAAEAEEDWELVDRVFDIYDSQERSINAQKQNRGPGGKFGETENGAVGAPKAHLPQALPLVTDVKSRIAQYIQDAAAKKATPNQAPAAAPADPTAPAPAAGTQASQQQEFAEGDGTPDPATPAAPAGGSAPDPGAVTDVRPLYLAIVDSVDTTAVLDVVSLVPNGNGDVVCWKRNNGTWIAAPDVLAELRGVTPPPVVELSDDTMLKGVLDQVDQATAGGSTDGGGNGTPGETPTDSTGAPTNTPAPDANPDQHPVAASADYADFKSFPAEKRNKLADKGYALPDGSFPIESVQDLKNAISAFGRAKNKNAARKHIVKRARALNRLDLVPNDWDKSASNSSFPMWGPHGEIISLVAVGGVEVSPKDAKNTERLRQYWEHGEGGAKIRWGEPNDWYRCVSHLSKYLGPRAKGYCTLRHHAVLGKWPGQEDPHGHGHGHGH